MEATLEKLEERIERLIQKCKTLESERSTLAHDNQKLQTQHVSTAKKIETIISRLKTMEDA